MQQPNNPYQNASSAYSNNKAASMSDPRTLEAQALLKAAAKLDAVRNELRENPNLQLSHITPALDYHKKLWIVFADSAGDDDHELPQEIKNNIGSLAVFMFNRILDIMVDATPEKFNVMIDINRQIASGLMKAVPKEVTENPNEVKTTEPALRAENSSIDA